MGFEHLSPEKRRQIASRGGKAAHRLGVANRFTKEEASEMGRLGGIESSKDRKRMAKIGAIGGNAVVRVHGREHMQKIGGNGGRARSRP